MMALRSILEGKEQTIHSVKATATVLDAVANMCRVRVGALLVRGHDGPIGIVSERDILRRVLLARREPSTTRIDEVMTREIVTIDLDAEPGEAMAVMTARRVRHLPVVQNGIMVGIVSLGDLVHWANRDQDDEIRTLKEYVSGPFVRIPERLERSFWRPWRTVIPSTSSSVGASDP